MVQLRAIVVGTAAELVVLVASRTSTDGPSPAASACRQCGTRPGGGPTSAAADDDHDDHDDHGNVGAVDEYRDLDFGPHGFLTTFDHR